MAAIRILTLLAALAIFLTIAFEILKVLNEPLPISKVEFHQRCEKSGGVITFDHLSESDCSFKNPTAKTR